MKLGRQWERRFEIWDEAFESNIYKKIESVDLEGFTTMEYLTWKEAQKMRFRKFPVGTCWGVHVPHKLPHKPHTLAPDYGLE